MLRSNQASLTHQVMKQNRTRISEIDDGPLDPILKRLIFITDNNIKREANGGKASHQICSLDYNVGNPRNLKLLKRLVRDHYRRQGFVVDPSFGFIDIKWSGLFFFIKQLWLKATTAELTRKK